MPRVAVRRGSRRREREDAFRDFGGTPPSAPALQQLVLAQMNTLDYVPAVVEHPTNILRVHCTRKMRVAVVASIASCC